MIFMGLWDDEAAMIEVSKRLEIRTKDFFGRASRSFSIMLRSKILRVVLISYFLLFTLIIYDSYLFGNKIIQKAKFLDMEILSVKVKLSLH
jgi:hypothetical protein